MSMRRLSRINPLQECSDSWVLRLSCCRNMLQRVAACCSVMQRVVCIVLQCIDGVVTGCRGSIAIRGCLYRVAACCNVELLQSHTS